ncbi:MAG: TonB-dependent receptor plug domain-containing protein [Candidatus Coatesbacteria bacterium]|nr:TonB-dependent receptor plug domain-containing protein [Candidatus Coatesbacteria bacterium]
MNPPPRRGFILVAALSILMVAGAVAQQDLPEKPRPELTPEQLERDRLLAEAFHEAYLEDDLTDSLIIGGSLRNVESTPFAVSVISGARLREFNYAGLADALAFEAGLYPDQRYRLGDNGGLAVRGHSTQHLRVYIDGLPVDHGVWWSEALARIPLNLVRRVEILRTPGGGLYAGAPGGVINVVTRSARRPTLAVAQVGGGSGTYNDQSYWGRFTDQRWRLAYKVGGSKWSADSAEHGLDSDGGDLDAELAFDLGLTQPGERYDDGRIGIYARSHYSRYGDRWSHSEAQRRDDLNLYSYGAWLELPLADWGRLRGDLRYNDRERSRSLTDYDQLFPGELPEPSYYEADVYDGLLKLDLAPWRGARLGLTLDGWLEESTAYADDRLYRYGGALSLEQGLFEGLTQIVAAARYDEDSRCGGAPAFSLGFLQGLQHRLGLDSVFVNYADGHRPPSLEERQRAIGELEPERGWNLEAGLRVTRLDPLKLQLTGYYGGLADALSDEGAGLVNAAESRELYGGELELTLGHHDDPWIQGGIGRDQIEQKNDELRGSPLRLRLVGSLAWRDDKGPWFMGRAALGYAGRFFQGDLTLTGEAHLSYANRILDTAYPGEPGTTPDTDLFTLDLLIRARVIDFDISLRLNNLIGGGMEFDGLGRLTAPPGFHLSFSWVFYD